MTRTSAKTALLKAAGWGDADLNPLAGDASNRVYLRATHPDGQTAVLMDADPAKGEDTRPFVALTRHLTRVGLSPPQVIAADEDAGFLLLEDLGDALFARVVDADPTQEAPLYLAAADALLQLHQADLPDLLPYDHTTMPALAALAVTWYADGPEGHVSTLSNAMRDALIAAPDLGRVVVLRDFHAENLIWLPDRPAPRNVGLLDYQDARIGDPTYDLASMLKDVRRDVATDTQDRVITHVLSQTGWDRGAFAVAFATQSAQRNLRILGVFARLSLKYGKPHYVDWIPRTWAHLQDDLSHPALATLKEAVAQTLPHPTPALLADLKARCGTCP